MTGNASSATAVLIGYIAEGTKTIRVGSGGIMLPNHAPLVIANNLVLWHPFTRAGLSSGLAGRQAPIR